MQFQVANRSGNLGFIGAECAGLGCCQDIKPCATLCFCVHAGFGRQLGSQTFEVLRHTRLKKSIHELPWVAQCPLLHVRNIIFAFGALLMRAFVRSGWCGVCGGVLACGRHPCWVVGWLVYFVCCVFFPTCVLCLTFHVLQAAVAGCWKVACACFLRACNCFPTP